MTDASRIPTVQAQWDKEAHVWVALSDDVPGLVVEAASLDELSRELQLVVPDLLDLNGMPDGDLAPFQLIAEFGKSEREAA